MHEVAALQRPFAASIMVASISGLAACSGRALPGDTRCIEIIGLVPRWRRGCASVEPAQGRSTGLPCNIWLGQRGLAHEAPHIHVQPDHRSQFDLDNLAVVGVDPVEVIEGDLSAQDLALVRRYILLNRQAILDHWNEYTDGVELIRALKSLVP